MKRNEKGNIHFCTFQANINIIRAHAAYTLLLPSAFTQSEMTT